MDSEVTPQCTDSSIQEEQGNDNNSPAGSDSNELCNAAVEIDNALSDEPMLLQGQPEFFPLSIPEGDAVNDAREIGELEKESSMEVQEGVGETSMAEEEAASDQSALSEGIIINTEGMNKVAAFDSEFPPPVNEDPLAMVKMEPLDPDEDTIFTEFETAPNLSLSQSALQLQFTGNNRESSSTNIKQEAADNCRKTGNKKDSVRKKKDGKKLLKKLSRPVSKNFDITPLGRKIFQRGHNLKAEDLPPVNATDLCLVCSAPCVITRNRKIPSLPFCRKCKKAYFYQLGHSRKRELRCTNGNNCVIHFKSGSHCPVCQLKKFQKVLRVAQSTFRSRSDEPPREILHPKITLKKPKESSIFLNDQRLIQEALHSYPLVVLNKMPLSPNETVDTKDMPDVLISVERKSSSDNRTSPRPSLRMSDIPSDVTVKEEVPCVLNKTGPSCSSTTPQPLYGARSSSSSTVPHPPNGPPPNGAGPLGTSTAPHPLHGTRPSGSSTAFLSFNGAESSRSIFPHGLGPLGSQTEIERNKAIPKLGPIKIPFFSSQSKATKSNSSLSISSSPEQIIVTSPPGQEIKRGRGRPRKNSTPTPMQPRVENTSKKQPILDRILRERPAEPKKVEAGDKDIKIFVFQCGHACSSCNNSTSKSWLRQNGYSSVNPSPQYSHSFQPESSLYQKFLEFYNAAVNSDSQKTSSKTCNSSERPLKVIKASNTIGVIPATNHVPMIPTTNPIPINMIPNSASSSQPQMILFPPPPHVLNLTSPPISSPSSNFNLGSTLTSYSSKPIEAIHAIPVSTGHNQVCSQFQSAQKSEGKKNSNIPITANVTSMSAVRMALNSRLMKQDSRMDHSQPNRLPNRLFLQSQSFPLGLPLQTITPSSSVRQPGAPYFLTPSSKSSSPSRPKKP